MNFNQKQLELSSCGKCKFCGNVWGLVDTAEGKDKH